MQDLTAQAINLGLQGISDSNSAARDNLASQIDLLIEDALSAANTRHLDSYLFAGHQVDTEPFRLVSGTPDSVAYDGDAGVIQRTIGPDLTTTINFEAQTVFSPIFEAMIAARDALVADDVSALQLAVSDLKSAQEGVKQQRAVNGIRLKQMEDNQSYLEETQLAIQDLLSQEEDIDLVEVITELRHQETVFQATMQVGQRTLATVNLFDLMK
jgi:flagellar hook-associated protein 3 FlgL